MFKPGDLVRSTLSRDDIALVSNVSGGCACGVNYRCEQQVDFQYPDGERKLQSERFLEQCTWKEVWTEQADGSWVARVGLHTLTVRKTPAWRWCINANHFSIWNILNSTLAKTMAELAFNTFSTSQDIATIHWTGDHYGTVERLEINLDLAPRGFDISVALRNSEHLKIYYKQPSVDRFFAKRFAAAIAGKILRFLEENKHTTNQPKEMTGR